MKRIVVAIVLCTLATGALFAEGELPYVDIEEANARITKLQGDIEDYTAEIDERTRSTASIEQEIAGWQSELVEIDPILTRVSAELSDLFSVNRTIVDEQMKTRAQDAIGRARTIKRNLEATIRELNRNITEARTEMETNRSRVRILNSRIGDNEEEIAFLQAAIAQTQAQQERLDTYIVNVDSILSDAERFIQTADSETE